MRRIATAAACALLCAQGFAADVTDRAVEAAAAKAMEGLGPAKLGDVKSVAVLPLWDDADGHAADMVKAALNRQGVEVFARSPKEWDLLLGEIEWNTRREDVMDAATIQRFGKIQGCDGVLYGTVRDVGVQDTPIGKRGHAALSLHIADVETGRLVWSSGPVQGEFLDKRRFVERIVMHPAFWIGAGALVVIVILGLVIRRATRPR